MQLRLSIAEERTDTTRMWKLIVAAIEQGFAEYSGMDNMEAKKMKGREAPHIIKVTEKPEVKDRWAEDSKAKNMRDLAAAYGAQARRLAHMAARQTVMRKTDDDREKIRG